MLPHAGQLGQAVTVAALTTWVLATVWSFAERRVAAYRDHAARYAKHRTRCW